MAQLPSDAAIATELERVLMQLMVATWQAAREHKDLSTWLPEHLAEARGRIWTLMEMYRRLHGAESVP